MNDRDENGEIHATHARSDRAGRTRRFFNPWVGAGFTDRGLLDVLRWKLRHNPYDKSVRPRVPRVANDGAYLLDPGAADSITWVGHSSFAVQDGGEVFLTDPHWGERALVPRRHTPPGIPLAAVPASAFAVLSHNHYDHLDTWTAARLPPTVEWYAPLGVGATLRAAGTRQVTELDWWQSVRRGRWTLTCLPAQHWSNRFGVARNSTLWCSWLLDSGRRRYYFAGDSGYFGGFAEIGRRHGPLDVAFLPIGAYEPRWFMAGVHMDPQDSYRAFRELGARWMLPMHWGTFDLTDEPIDLPPSVLAAAQAAAGGDPAAVRTLAVGERWLLPPSMPSAPSPP